METKSRNYVQRFIKDVITEPSGRHCIKTPEFQINEWLEKHPEYEIKQIQVLDEGLIYVVFELAQYFIQVKDNNNEEFDLTKYLDNKVVIKTEDDLINIMKL